MAFAEILFQQKVGLDKDCLTYEIPSGLDIKIGQLVKVKLRGKEKTGLVWKIGKEKPEFKTFPIDKIIKNQPFLSENQIKLTKWISKYYFCPLHKTIKLFIPKRVFNDKKIPKKLAEQKISHGGIEKMSDLEKTLTEDQKEALSKILNSQDNKFLIQGITGSGKTEIYVNLAKNYIEKNKQVLILIPEISLTPQMVEYFEKALGLKASVINSRLSDTERQKCWTSIFEEKSKLIIGSRSAVFAPIQNPGIIIVDEEHELSYKQDQSPRYSTHKVIDKILELNKDLKVVFGSATPSIETAERLKESTIKLTQRIGEGKLPEVELIDLRDEFKKKNYSIFSDSLRQEIHDVLAKNEQAILFLNRRGSASSVVCRDCGQSFKCSNCELPMTYHAKTLGRPILICHHCGKLSEPPTICPNCKGPNIRFLGIGTQRIEEDLGKDFPEAKVLRADRDTTSNKHGFEEIYRKFKSHEANILVGTQMIAKGLDLPKVNLVGVVLADIGLNIPDYRTMERNFQLITQVSGRAGRNSITGKVVVQTYDPTNLALMYAQNHDYEGFFKYESVQRKILCNPPFCQLVKLLIQGPALPKCKILAEKIENNLLKIAKEENFTEDLEITAYPAYITRLRNKFRYIVLIKNKAVKEKPNIIHEILEKLPKEYIMDKNIIIDVDPISTI